MAVRSRAKHDAQSICSFTGELLIQKHALTESMHIVNHLERAESSEHLPFSNGQTNVYILFFL
jgi:hypothetical protein